MDALTRALAATPGASQTRSKAPGRVGPCDPAGAFPLFAEGGRGPYVYAGPPDNRWFLDFVGANAAIPLGYHRREVTRAVEAVTDAPLLSLPSSLEAEVAEQLVATVAPWAEQVRFVKTGSEACTGALQIAHEFHQPLGTGGPPRRRNIYRGTWSYHGWHPWANPLSDENPRVFSYPPNDSDLLQRLERDAEAAVVFWEPPRFGLVDRLWLAALRESCTKHGIVLVFDEMVMGLRLAKGGASEFYGVTPDLALYGKALANGFPLAAIVGRRAHMGHATMAVSGTFGGERVGLAAARAVLDIYRREPVIETLWANGRAFLDEYHARALSQTKEWPALAGTPVHFRVEWDTKEQADRVLERCAKHGVLFHRDACNASAAMTVAQAIYGARVLANAVAAEVG